MKKTNKKNYSFVVQKSPLRSLPQLQRMSDDKDLNVYRAYKEKCYDPCETSYLSCVHAAICKDPEVEECENPSVILCWLPAVVASLACFPVTVCCGVSKSCCGFFAYHCGDENDKNNETDSDSDSSADRFRLQDYR